MDPEIVRLPFTVVTVQSLVIAEGVPMIECTTDISVVMALFVMVLGRLDTVPQSTFRAFPIRAVASALL